ncbi:type II toxin-antitoxin system death-on-curing family toxin [Streptomyces rectiverticillatus]|uniref:type II toxin-antitoxin system death-on-curing family toxin n=1 Tax=Streptomyces rectiverticillatus TaxID=173860 RepID=UPI0015C2CB5B|nr:Fic family protein [Streptomyces rectiverticillatus]QLE75153.1 type II toxin-antitoxin system death-on-curing family toxin [Streptomyces rectiverticillatus]
MTPAYLTPEDALIVAGYACADDTPVVLRDTGQLESAVHRPSAEMYGHEVYPDLISKGAALLQALSINHPLIDGNKRTAWLACVTFLAMHGVQLRPEIDAAERLVLAVTTGRMREVEEIAQGLRALLEPDVMR